MALRRLALDAVERGLADADPYEATRRLVGLDGGDIRIGEGKLRSADIARIVVLGAGKASYPIARALEDILGSRIKAGVVVSKYGQEGELKQARLRLAGHPIPDRGSVRAAGEMAALARATGPGDLVFAAITGGSSALLALPADGLSLADKQAVNRLLLSSGADIFEINAVRKHLSAVKGGRLARMLDDRACLVNLTVSDVVGDALDYITDPTVADTSTLADARLTLDKYDLWPELPATIRAYLGSGGPARETLKSLAPLEVRSHILIDSMAAVRATAAYLPDAGARIDLALDALVGESALQAPDFAGRAARSDMRESGGVLALVAGGENTVRLGSGVSGRGGPNQEFALAAARTLAGEGPAVLMAIDTDGSDGPTKWAGAIVDSTTVARAEAAGLDIDAHLARPDSTAFFEAIGDAVGTGATGTNANDLKLLLVGATKL